MEKFIDKTASLKEPAVKVGDSVPKDAVNLAWFSSKDISPKNNLTFVDLSGLIPENINTDSSFSKLMYANELGILEDENGDAYVPSDDVYISDVFLEEETFDKPYTINEVVEKKYVSSYYVSHFFTLLKTKSHFDSGINYYLEKKYIPNNIKVLDKDGKLYADQETGRLKYRISLESFITEDNTNALDIPHKIIVLLEDSNPKNLTLTYDKVECDESGFWSNQFLNYTETINSIPIFKKVQEETEVVDPSNLQEKSFAIKRNSKSVNIYTNSQIQEENQIFVNKKALDDNRVFEIFNWRLVGKVKSAANLSEINYGEDVQRFANSTNSIQVGVLYSSSNCFSNDVSSTSFNNDAKKINPFVFYNLQNSPFNIFGFNFDNKFSSAIEKNNRSYWLIDIDTITDDEIKQYDILSLSLYWKLNLRQAEKIRSFINSAGTIIIDASGAQSDLLENFDSRLTISTYINSEVPTSKPNDYSATSILLNSEKNNTFNIDSNSFSTDCGIYGYAKKVDSTYKRYPHFSNTDLDSVLSHEDKTIFTHIRKSINTDSLIAGNIVASTTGFLSYCNDIYYASNLNAEPNDKVTAIPVASTSTFSRFVEGPYKFLYNCVLVGRNDKTESTRSNQDIRSSVHIFSGKWRNDWVIDEEVLFEDEKSNFFSSDVVSSEIKQVKNIINNPKSLYLEEIQNVYSWFKDVFLDSNENSLELYIEFTNPNVQWTNTIVVTDEEKSEISSSYNLAKVSNKNATCSVYTNKKSPSFLVPSGFGAHVIKPKLIPSRNFEPIKKNTVPIKNYPFNLTFNHSYLSGSNSVKEFDVTFNFEANVKFDQNQTFIKPELKDPGTPDTTVVRPGARITLFPKTFTTTQGETDPQLSVIKNNLNCFAYTGDIDAGNDWDEYRVGGGSDSAYRKYIQLTLNVAGFTTPVKGGYTTATAEAVKKFQKSRGIKEDGIVDSQTKQYLAKVWKTLKKNNATTYNNYIKSINQGNYGNTDIDKYIKAAVDCMSGVNSVDADDVLSAKKVVKLINFSGISSTTRDPEQIWMWVKFNFPQNPKNIFGVDIDVSDIQKIEKICIEAPNFSSKATKYKGISVIDFNFNGSTTRSRAQQRTIGPVKDGNRIEIKLDINNRPNSVRSYQDKQVAILLQGSDLGGSFGATAEGMAIGKIYFVVKLKDGPSEVISGATPTFEYSTRLVTAKIDGVVKGSYTINGINLNTKNVNIGTAEFIQNNCTLKSLQYKKFQGEQFTDELISYTATTNPPILLNNNSFKPNPDAPEVIDLSSIDQSTISLVGASVSISSVKSSGETTEYDQSYVNYSTQNNSINLTSNVLLYNVGEYYQESSAVNDYFLRNLDGTIIVPGKNTVNYYDQVALLCKEDGSPIKPTNLDFSDISNNLNPEQDPYYSEISIKNTGIDEPGLLYGFYDIVSRKFLGKKITYEKYMSVGPQNIYIGLYAFDYDGNLETIKEFTEVTSGDTYSPVNVPVKMAYPVYKINCYPRNKIQIIKTPDRLEKTEPWPLHLTSGSFNRSINVSEQMYSNFLSKYKGQTLLARYDTSNLSSTPFSKIFGRGYFDVIDETPVVNGPYSISVKRTPIHRVHQPSADLSNFASSFVYVVSVYTRTSEESPWVKVSKSKIRNINCEEGLIEFTEPIISFNEKLNKVSYTIKDNSLLLKQCNGVPIPINPFLNRNEIEFNKPLYIYLKPKQIYKSKNFYNNDQSEGLSQNNTVPVVLDWTLVPEYESESIVNFTYNNNIFNKLDKFEYDPLALLIGVIYVSNTLSDDNFNTTDLRVKGGGISSRYDTNKILSDIQEAISYWDVYPPLTEAYPKGGYVIIRIPTTVKKNFTDPNEVYDVIRKNLTAGVVFDIQDMDGNDWSNNA